MTAVAATINGQRITRALVHVPAVGAWWVDVDLEEDPDLDGAVTLRLPGLDLSGTVVPSRSGTHLLERRVRVLAGAGAWGSPLPARAYHNDAQVRAAAVIEDAAREAGETLADVAPARAQLGIDFARAAGPAARTLELAAGGAAWWVGYDGRTRVGSRPSTEIECEVIDYDPRGRLVTLAAEDLSAVVVGSVLRSERLDEPQTVRGLELDVQADQVRVRAWTGAQDGSTRGRLADALRGIVRKVTDGPIYGPRRYRVVQMSGERVELQAVDRSVGLPDLKPLSMWPGMAGLHAQLTPGAHVLVQFVDGSPAQPIVTHFVGKDGAGWAPAELVLDASSVIKVGAQAAQFVALANLVKARLDAIQAKFDAHIHNTTATVGTGSVGVISPPTDAIGALDAVAATLVKAE